MLPDLPSRQAASYVGPWVGWGVHLHQSMSGVFFFSETGVVVLDELESVPCPPLDLILPLTVGVILLRARSGGVSLLVIEGVGLTLLILRLAN
jgi:hypothetical protein